MALTGQSFLGSQRGAHTGALLFATNPQSGEKLGPGYASVSAAEAEQAVELAGQAAPLYSALSGKERAAFLRRIADAIDAIVQPLTERAHLETALPIARLQGETARTTGQLRLFASVVRAGEWLDLRVDPALPERQPLPRPDGAA